jgi:flagellar FliL protein
MVSPYFNKVVLMLIALMTFQFHSSSVWAEDPAPAVQQPVYYAFAEPFTINFLRQSNDKYRYLQVKVTVMSHDQSAIDNTELNLPMIQDAFRTLFTIQTIESVTSVDGRREIQKEALTTINTLLKEETGNGNIEGVYFTSFILQ